MLTLQADPAEGSARDDDHLSPQALVARGWSRTRAGEVRAALGDLEAARQGWSALDGLDRAVLLSSAIDCRLARGELAPAMDDGVALAELLDGTGLPAATAHFGCGELAAATSAADVAAGHYAAHLAQARAARAPYATALGLRTLATVDVRADGVSTLRDARAALATTPASRLAAQVATDLAGVLLLSGGNDAETEAVGLLRPAEEYAGREQLYPLQGRIRRLLDRLGEPARPVLAEALAVLTASEARVATPRRRRAHEPRDRALAAGHGQGRRVAPVARLPQARHPLPRCARHQPRGRLGTLPAGSATAWETPSPFFGRPFVRNPHERSFKRATTAASGRGRTPTRR